MNLPNFRILFFELPNLLLHFNQLLGKKVPKLLESYIIMRGRVHRLDDQSANNIRPSILGSIYMALGLHSSVPPTTWAPTLPLHTRHLQICCAHHNYKFPIRVSPNIPTRQISCDRVDNTHVEYCSFYKEGGPDIKRGFKVHERAQCRVLFGGR